MGRLKAPTTDHTPTTLPPDHRLVIVGAPQGSANYLCTDTGGEERLVEVGYKLKKTTLITRALSRFLQPGTQSNEDFRKLILGDFAFIQLFPPSPTPSSGAAAKAASESKKKSTRLAGEIIAMISSQEVKGWKKSGEWPAGFGEPKHVDPPVEPAPQETEETGGYVSDEEDNEET